MEKRLLTLLAALGCVVVVGGAGPPAWPQTYQVEGRIQLPYAEIDEPFIAYFDDKAHKSRIDYYDATVMTIQIGSNATQYGMNYKIAYMTTIDDLTPKQACFAIAGTNDSKASVQPVLPDLVADNYTDAGSEKIGNVTLKKWQMVKIIGLKKNTYTMWIDAKGKPVRFEMIGYDTLMGSHYDRYYLLYSNYIGNGDKFPKDIFEVPAAFKDKCGDFPGPGDAEHKILINPMQEYIQGDASHVDDMFDKFKKIHQKGYPSGKEHERRKNFFKQNLRYIQSINRAGLGYTVAINHFADMEDGEIALMRGRQRSQGYNGGLPFDTSKVNLKEIPDYVDWRLYGAVTPVKDQAVCGSCWSFGSTGTLEGAVFLKTGNLVRLSQQELVDCSWGQLNNGCDGGEDFRSYEYIQKNGLHLEESYGPYLGQDGKCHTDDKPYLSKGELKGYVNVTSPDVTDVATKLLSLKIAIAKHGPISIGIDASVKSFSFYSNGVYYDPACGNTADDLDHAVLAVGYGVLNGKPYWLVKNSWSTHWGNDGYILMSWENNNCGPATAPTFVLL